MVLLRHVYFATCILNFRHKLVSIVWLSLSFDYRLDNDSTMEINQTIAETISKLFLLILMGMTDGNGIKNEN